MLFTLLACNVSENTETYQVGFSQLTSNDAWRKEMNEEIFTEARLNSEVDINILFRDATYDNELQIQQIYDLLETGIDLLIVSPNQAEPLTPVIEHVFEQNIPVILIDRKINSEKFTTYVGGNNLGVGTLAGDYATKFSNDDVLVEITGMIGSTPAQMRSEGFQNRLKENNLFLDFELHSDWSNKKGFELTDSLMSEQQVDFIFAHNDRIAAGARRAAEKHNQDPVILGVDGLNTEGGGIDMVLNDEIDATIFYPTGGDRAVQLAIRILNGEQVPKENYYDTFLIDKENVRSLRFYGDRIDEERTKLLNQIDRIGAISGALKQANTTMLFLGLSLLLLISTLALSLYSIYMRNKKNRLLSEQKEVIATQNEKISKQRDDLLKAVRKVEQMAEYRSNFFQNLSHELKNHLTLIQLDADEISTTDPSSKEAAHHLKYNVEKLKKTIYDLLNFKDVEELKKEPVFKYGNVSAFVEEVIMNFKPQIEKKGLSMHFQAKPIHCDFDSSILENVLNNLMTNAVKYTDKGSLTIEVKRETGFVSVYVADTGKGITLAEQEYIFQRYATSINRKNIDDSHGIGLAYAQDLMFLHNGSISVESQKGKGATFIIKFPVKQSLSRESVYSESNLNAPNILIVEDNKQLRNHLAAIVETQFSVKLAKNGIEALRVCEQWVPDLVISDILMDEMDGIELCKTMKTNQATQHIPVILLTAMSTEETILNAYDVGADDFITKPFRKQLILSRITNLLEKKKNQQAVHELINHKNVNQENQQFLNTIIQLVMDNLHEEYTIDEMAKEMNFSRTSFYNKVKELTETTPVSFIRKIKLHRSVALLRETDLNISEIAFESGFMDTKYFSKCFKKEFGMNPSEYSK